MLPIFRWMASWRSYERLVAIIEAQNEIASAELDAREVLSLVVTRCCALTGADSAVVKLADGAELAYPADGDMRQIMGSRPRPPVVRVPLLHRGRVLGSLKVYARSPDEFDAQDEAVVQLLAGLLAPHLHEGPGSEARPPESRLDALTGLPNRRAFTVRLGAEVARVRRHGGQLALCPVDVGGFQEVTDSLGRV